MSRRVSISTAFILMLVSMFAAACAQRFSPATETEPARLVVDDGSVYVVRGVLKEIRRDGHELVIEHEAIPGYMAAMTMPFRLKEAVGADGPKPGDAVQFTYVVARTGAWIDAIERLEMSALELALEQEPEYVAPSGESLYQLTSTWTDAQGRQTRLADLQGRPVVVSMVFTNCGYACPMIVHDMKTIAAGLPEEMQEDVQFLLVSLDPARDTPEALTRFADAYGLNPANWTLLRGEAADVRMLAAMLGIRYREQADGQFAHTSLLTLLDENGEIIHQKQGTGTNEDLTVVLLDLLSQDHNS